MPTRMQLLVATNNLGKSREIQESLNSLPVRLRFLTDFPNISQAEETGRTYEENAVIKALEYSRQTGVHSLADDSGLEVDALDGRPGVLSARFGGYQASDSARTNKLLTELSQIEDGERTARFVCCMALVGWRTKEELINKEDPHLIKVTSGECEGFITRAPRGTKGFGFDPVFVPAGYDQTFAELPESVKANISHRARALRAMRVFLDRELTELDRVWAGT